MKTQAWGWLAAAVMAAGLNASYHDGGLQWAHEFADQVVHNSNAVIDLATGRAEQFLAEERFLNAGELTPSGPLATAFAEVKDRVATCVQSRIVASDGEFAKFQGMSVREEAQLARIEANGARIEARLTNARIPAMAFNSVVVPATRISICPRVRVNAPRPLVVRVPAVPMVHIDMPGAGPV